MSDEHTSNAGPTPKPLLPPQVGQWWERIRYAAQQLPPLAKLLLILASLIAAGLAGYFSLVPMFQDYGVLYSRLDPEEAGTIVSKLEERDIPFRLIGDGTTIEVPKDRLSQLRLQLASEGLPKGGQVGFESFEKLRLGASEFEQQVTYRRAMEGELAKTIATVKSIQSARVHLVLPKQSVFSSRSEPASASVVVRLNDARGLSKSEVAGIINLVASAVTGLEPEAVTLVTTDGTMLHRPKKTHSDEDGLDIAGDDEQFLWARKHELELEQRTRTMLEQVLGPGHVDVRIRADVDTAKVERKSDRYDPKTTSLRSEQDTVERTSEGGTDGVVAGVPGAESNIPTGEPVQGDESEMVSDRGVIRRSRNRNFEVDHVQERRVSVTHTVNRLAVAVIVDGVTAADGKSREPRPDKEIAELAEIVKSAVGYTEARGDVVTVKSVTFFEQPEPEITEEPPVLPIPDKYQRFVPLAKYAGTGLLGLIILLVLRRRWKKAVAERRAKQLQQLEEAKQQKLLEAAEDAQPKPELESVDYKIEALERAKADPATAALVIRQWLGAESAEAAAA